MRWIALSIILAGCASLPGPFQTSTAETMVPPDQAARLARQVLDAHRIPVRRTNDRRNVDTGWFDASQVWQAGAIDAVIECSEGKDDRQPGGRITMNIEVNARERHRRNDQRQPIGVRPAQYLTVVSMRSTGKRADGARCKLTDTYTAQLINEIAGLGGRPVRAGG